MVSLHRQTQTKPHEAAIPHPQLVRGVRPLLDITKEQQGENP
jgi:hypothetical protein